MKKMLIIAALLNLSCATMKEAAHDALVCSFPSASAIALSAANCNAQGEDPMVCSQGAALTQLLPFLECMSRLHNAKKCDKDSCPFEAGAKIRVVE